jgi:hypothetical protein
VLDSGVEHLSRLDGGSLVWDGGDRSSLVSRFAGGCDVLLVGLPLFWLELRIEEVRRVEVGAVTVSDMYQGDKECGLTS